MGGWNATSTSSMTNANDNKMDRLSLELVPRAHSTLDLLTVPAQLPDPPFVAVRGNPRRCPRADPSFRPRPFSTIPFFLHISASLLDPSKVDHDLREVVLRARADGGLAR